MTTVTRLYKVVWKKSHVEKDKQLLRSGGPMRHREKFCRNLPNGCKNIVFNDFQNGTGSHLPLLFENSTL